MKTQLLDYMNNKSKVYIYFNNGMPGCFGNIVKVIIAPVPNDEIFTIQTENCLTTCYIKDIVAVDVSLKEII